MFSFVMLIVLLTIFVLPKMHKTDDSTADALVLVGLASAAAAVWNSLRVLSPRRVSETEVEYKDIGHFQNDMIICLGLAELPALLGVFTEPSNTFAYVLIGATLFVMLFVIAPKVLRYVKTVSASEI
ncbi:MAG TPA: hypothetical protein VNI20_00230 [Fimbriimonadaceae bacterium]|nr:hypothetical protein [Fimbriimonadaceae bacterium]